MPFTFLDVILALIFVAVCVISLTQGLLRQLISLGILYLGTVFVGASYSIIAHFMQAIGPNTPTLREAIVFLCVMSFFVFIMELVMRRWFPNTRFPKLGVFDAILAIIPGILSAAIILGLLLSTLGYATAGPWGSQPVPARDALARTVNQSEITPYAGEFMRYYTLTHRAWFRPMPPLLDYLVPDEV